ncbi:hypothetical protein BD410DRAFT_381042 [Rickenella mellea]|uniref:Uncharacterized protein n=1 Tax=Rickenella mellea TaxID=50990 RepID=A0A4Y7Q0H5_9AGAM|nr:hypothetical protein BD410DRAFT_381042 [Rickenella mellea]
MIANNEPINGFDIESFINFPPSSPTAEEISTPSSKTAESRPSKRMSNDRDLEHEPPTKRKKISSTTSADSTDAVYRRQLLSSSPQNSISWSPHSHVNSFVQSSPTSTEKLSSNGIQPTWNPSSSSLSNWATPLPPTATTSKSSFIARISQAFRQTTSSGERPTDAASRPPVNLSAPANSKTTTVNKSQGLPTPSSLKPWPSEAYGSLLGPLPIDGIIANRKLSPSPAPSTAVDNNQGKNDISTFHASDWLGSKAIPSGDVDSPVAATDATWSGQHDLFDHDSQPDTPKLWSPLSSNATVSDWLSQLSSSTNSSFSEESSPSSTSERSLNCGCFPGLCTCVSAVYPNGASTLTSSDVQNCGISPHVLQGNANTTPAREHPFLFYNGKGAFGTPQQSFSESIQSVDSACSSGVPPPDLELRNDNESSFDALFSQYPIRWLHASPEDVSNMIVNEEQPAQLPPPDNAVVTRADSPPTAPPSPATIPCRWLGCDGEMPMNHTGVREHMQKRHYPVYERGSTNVMLHCEWDGCRLARPMQLANFLRHMYTSHTPLTTVLCERCGKKLSRMDSGVRHDKNCLVCSKCGVRSATKEEHEQHTSVSCPRKTSRKCRR